MNKFLVTLIAAAGFLTCYAGGANTAPREIIEISGNSTYIGSAPATRRGTPDTNAAVWAITRLVTAGAVTEITHAFNTNAAGDQLVQNAWTNRVNAVYK